MGAGFEQRAGDARPDHDARGEAGWGDFGVEDLRDHTGLSDRRTGTALGITSMTAWHWVSAWGHALLPHIAIYPYNDHNSATALGAPSPASDA